MEIFIYDLWLLTLWIGIANWLSKLIVYFINISSDKIDNKMVFFFFSSPHTGITRFS